ncbi:MAG TPA: glycoside hydrolase family 3 N-terminal domain-containing protein [Saprospiraceae bacterium]|nr:glycoside hydrolase family 3 N-terminal domain-containing protein [Saprospiraceae bacterium]
MVRILSICVIIFFLFSCKTQQPKGSAAKTGSASKEVTAKIDSIMALMTLEEKIGQMTLFTTDWGSTGPTIREGYQEDIRKGLCGALFNSHTVAFTRQLQEIAVKESRLHIPLIFGYDVIHGYKTIFPMPLAESCSWDLAAMEKSASIAAAEASAAGLHWTFAPMVDISREPRWGRVMEGAGEDTYLGTLIARARVRGFQGENFDHADRIMACIKHYAGYGAPVAGRDYNTVDMSERVFRDTYLPPYKAGIEEGAMTVMTSFNEYDGIPATANKFLLQDVLRNELGFKGFVVTDYTSINEMVNHGYARDERHAAELAVNAGVDMDLQGAEFERFLKDGVSAVRVSEKTIDASVRRILEAKYALGLFKDPYRFCNEAREKEVIMSPANLEAARDISRKSIVLLKNDKNTLPLPKKIKSIALVGPLAAEKSQLMGAWSGAGDGESCISVKEALSDRADKQGFKIKYVKGCEIEGDVTKGFTPAITAARNSDVVIVVVGESKDMSGEAAARSELTLPGVQEQLIKDLVGTGTPVIVVLMNGRPLTIPWIAEHASAILEAWWLGTEAGPAIADVLFGDYNPSAKLTMTFPRSIGQVPLYYNQKNTGRPYDANSKWNTKYLDIPNSPLYPFGYGLSYTTFKYDSIQLDQTEFSMKETLMVSVNVTNTGDRDGEEIVQLYVRDLVGSVTRPVKELKGFEKIKLAKGEHKMVNFKLTTDDLAFYTADMKFEAEPGKFWIMVGPDSEHLQKREVTLIK